MQEVCRCHASRHETGIQHFWGVVSPQTEAEAKYPFIPPFVPSFFLFFCTNFRRINCETQYGITVALELISIINILNGFCSYRDTTHTPHLLNNLNPILFEILSKLDFRILRSRIIQHVTHHHHHQLHNHHPPLNPPPLNLNLAPRQIHLHTLHTPLLTLHTQHLILNLIKNLHTPPHRLLACFHHTHNTTIHRTLNCRQRTHGNQTPRKW